jgi:anti-anti-sigma factor
MSEISPDLVIRQRGAITIIRIKTANLTSILDVTRMNRDIAELIAAGQTRLVLDLKYVRYAGSAALGMLLDIANRIRSAGGKLVLSHPENIEELLRVSKTIRLFTLAPDPREAIRMLGG